MTSCRLPKALLSHMEQLLPSIEAERKRRTKELAQQNTIAAQLRALNKRTKTWSENALAIRLGQLEIVEKYVSSSDQVLTKFHTSVVLRFLTSSEPWAVCSLSWLMDALAR